jgi:hypothetical protein
MSASTVAANIRLGLLRLKTSLVGRSIALVVYNPNIATKAGKIIAVMSPDRPMARPE